MWPASLSPHWGRDEVEEEPKAQFTANPQGQERELVHSTVKLSVNLGQQDCHREEVMEDKMSYPVNSCSSRRGLSQAGSSHLCDNAVPWGVPLLSVLEEV